MEALDQYFTVALRHLQPSAKYFFIAASIMCVLELLFPASKVSFRSRINGVSYRIVFILVSAFAFAPLWSLWGSLGIGPWRHIDLSLLSSSPSFPLKVIGGISASIIIFHVSEFFYYWFHRLQHSNKFLWEFHSIHHSYKELSTFNSTHHFTEELLRIPIILIPQSMLFSFEQGYVPWVWATLLIGMGQYQHSCTKLNFGWFRYVLPDNRYHRIHHSIHPEHMDKNFTNLAPIWDILFGTAHFPKKGEWPDTGIANMDEPKTMTEFLFGPFQRLSRSKKNSVGQQMLNSDE